MCVCVCFVCVCVCVCVCRQDFFILVGTRWQAPALGEVFVCVVTLTKQKEAFTLCYFLVSIIKAATIVVQPPLECVEKASDLLKDGCRAPPPWVQEAPRRPQDAPRQVLDVLRRSLGG